MKEGKITLTIDTGQILTLSKDGGELIFKPEAENSILQLLWLEGQIRQALETVKSTIERKGLEYNPNFTSVTGDKVKVTYQYSGAQYGYNPEEIERFKAPFFERKVIRSLNSKEVDRFEQAHHGRLPKGVFRRDRDRRIVIRPAKEAQL